MWYKTFLKNWVEILPEVYKEKPSLITKYVYPAAFKLLEDSKTDMKGAVSKLIQILHKLHGSIFIGEIPKQKLEQVMEIIKG